MHMILTEALDRRIYTFGNNINVLSTEQRRKKRWYNHPVDCYIGVKKIEEGCLGGSVG